MTKDSTLSDASLTTYREMAEVVERLPLLLRETRRQRGMSQRDVAERTGITNATVNRIESGGAAHTRSIIAILRWLGES